MIGGVLLDYQGGGEEYDRYDMVAQFKDFQWSHYDKMYHGRWGHNSITVGGITMVLGGSSEDKNDE